MTSFCMRTFATALLLLPMASFAEILVISHVQPSSVIADPAKNQSVQVRFELNAPATVTLELYDGRDLLVREIRSNAVLPAGGHALAWDLRDSKGRAVPPEAYAYVLEARDRDGNSVRHDLTDVTGGEPITAREVRWDAHRGRLAYLLDRPSRVSVRIGLSDGGPLLRTMLDWPVRAAGMQEESWDGKDASGTLDLARNAKLSIDVQAFALPDNSILVGAPQTQVKLIPELRSSAKQRPKAASQPKRMYAHAQQPLESRGDFQIQLTLPRTLARSAAGLPIVSASVPLRLDVAAADRERALSRRFEPVFFVDGQFAFENEVGFIPMTWNFDPSTLNQGEHYLTVNLRGYEGNFGVATVKILVQREKSAAH